MGPFLAGIVVIGGPIPIVTAVLAGLAAVAVIVGLRASRGALRWLLTVVLALAGGAGLGYLACWLLGDRMDLFGVTLSAWSRAWVAIACAGVSLAIVGLVAALRRRGGSQAPTRWRASVAAVAVVLFGLLGAIGVNADFGQYTTIASMAGLSPFPVLPADVLARQKSAAAPATASTELWSTWHSPSGMPAAGLVGGVTIPATVSHFRARQAIIYLPPAALVESPPALPVLMVFSGQPGSPEQVFTAGHLARIMDAFATQHDGLAPIVVVPDQLSAPAVNPMCVDSARSGNSATYLTVDVPAWITANLAVQRVPSAWGVAGFSQGGTCAIQLGAGHPELFGSILDVSGELVPSLGSVEATIKYGFAGDAAAYAAATPLGEIASHAPFADSVAVFVAGELDSVFTARATEVFRAASSAGMRATLLNSTGTSHDWSTVRYAFQHGLDPILVHMGLVRP